MLKNALLGLTDVSQITDAGVSIGLIAAAAGTALALGFLWPVARKVYRVAKGALGMA